MTSNIIRQRSAEEKLTLMEEMLKTLLEIEEDSIKQIEEFKERFNIPLMYSTFSEQSRLLLNWLNRDIILLKRKMNKKE